MIYWTKLYVVTLIAFLGIDFVWLAFVARNFYKKHLGFILTSEPNWLAAFCFYLIFVAGMVVFVVGPSVQTGSLRKAMLLGAFFGMVTYATYDLTNHASLRNWPWIITLVDLCWGTVLAATVCTIGYFAGRWITGA